MLPAAGLCAGAGGSEQRRRRCWTPRRCYCCCGCSALRSRGALMITQTGRLHHLVLSARLITRQQRLAPDRVRPVVELRGRRRALFDVSRVQMSGPGIAITHCSGAVGARPPRVTARVVLCAHDVCLAVHYLCQWHTATPKAPGPRRARATTARLAAAGRRKRSRQTGLSPVIKTVAKVSPVQQMRAQALPQAEVHDGGAAAGQAQARQTVWRESRPSFAQAATNN